MKYLNLFLILLCLYSCANEVAPSGGDKDVTPPELKWAKPSNESVNFNSKNIEFKFDEFIKFKSSSDYIFISPPLNTKPKYILDGKKMRIEFKEELRANTTYSISFNEAIEDYNEGNKLNNLNYVFSTGTYIDSLSISGTVLNAFDNKPAENVLVLLYPEEEDSVLFKRPLYFAKTNTEGAYVLNNLKQARYKIACLEDKNLNYIFDQDNERISFQENIIDLNEDIITLPFYIFENIKENGIKENVLESESHLLIHFKEALSTINLDISDYNEQDIVYFSKDKKTLNYWFMKKDSLSLLSFNLDGVLDTLKLDLTNDYKLEEVFSVDASSYIVGETKTIEISSTLPIKEFDKEKLVLSSTSGESIPFTLAYGEHNLSLKLNINSPLDSIKLETNPGAISAFNNKTNTKIKRTFTDFNPTKSNLIINLPNKDFNYVLQIFNTEMLLIDEKIVSRETSIQFNDLNSGKYIIRVFDDSNNNGIWDSGLFHVKQFPEKTLFMSGEIELKPNWDKDLEIKF